MKDVTSSEVKVMHLLKFLLFVEILVIATVSQTQAENDDQKYPIVTTTNGQMRGAADESRDGRTFYKFLGIPYGKFKRFESATPTDSWGKLVLDATRPGPVCYQKSFHSQEIVGEEDCLSANVYTPILPSTSGMKLPVLFFVHGGGFWSGSGIMYNPNFFMDEDVVVVTVNYRLGPFGFFNLGIKEAPGNQALKDVILALKWVRDNIEVFNGNPDRVMIFGESAGGAIVSSLLYSPASQGLFTGIIAQSGPSTCEFFTNKRPKYYALLLAKKLGCTKTENPEIESYVQIVECLREKDKEELLNALNPMRPDWNDEDECAEPQYNFCVEDIIPGEEAALPELPLTMVTKGKYSKVPFMIGVNKYETYEWVAAQFSDVKTLKHLNDEWNRVAPMPLLYYHYGEWTGKKNPKRDELSKKIRKFYLKDAPLKNDKNSIENYDKLLSDRMETYPTRHLAQTLAAQGVPTYLYMFDKKMSRKEISPTHAEELNYMFSIPPPDGVSPPIGTGSPEYEFSKNLIKLWVSFAVNGKPTHTWGKMSQKWEPLDAKDADPKWYHLDDDRLESCPEDEEFKSRMEFWKRVEQEYAVKPKSELPKMSFKIESATITKSKIQDEL